MIIDEFTNDIDFSCLTREQQMDSVAWSLRLKPERSDLILTNQNDLFLNCKVNQYWLSCNILLQKLTNRNLFNGINWCYHAFGFIYLHSVHYKKYSAIRYFHRSSKNWSHIPVRLNDLFLNRICSLKFRNWIYV